MSLNVGQVNNNMPGGTTTSGVTNVGNHLSGYGTNNTSQTDKNDQTQSEVVRTTRMNEIFKILSKYELSPKFMQDLLTEKGNVSEQDLLEMDNITFQKIKISLEVALNDAFVDGKVDTEKLSRRFIGYKVNLLHMGVKDVETARKNLDEFEKMDLIDYIKLKNPTLQGKDISEISATELKEVMKNFIIKSYKSDKKKNPEAFMDCFVAMLGKCDDKEKAKIFHAFALLLKDADMQKIIPEAYQKVMTAFKDNEELANFVNKIGPKLLRALGFDDKTIQIITAQGFNKLNPEQIGAILDNIFEVFNNIDEADLLILGEALNAADNNKLDQLTDEQKDVLEKYLPYIQNAISSFAVSANRPELAEQLGEKYKNLLELINSEKFENIGFSDYVFNQVQQLYEQNPDLFKNVSEQEFTKSINKITNNQYSEAIGDTNPENLYKEENTNNETSSGIGFSQPTIQPVVKACEILQKTVDKGYISSDIANKYNTAISSKQTGSIETIKQKYNSMTNLTAKDIYDGLANNYIKIYDVLDNYKDLTKSAKDFVNGIIETMPPAVQSYVLYGIGGHEVLDIIKHTNINPEDLKNLALDFNSKKELKEMQEEKIVFEEG